VAVVIPIVSEFDGKGVSKAIKEFEQLGTTGEKAQFLLKKAAIPAAAALGGLAFAVGDATKAAIEDAKAQALLAQAIEKNTLAGKANVKAAEAYIEKTMMSAAVADDQLRPALATLVQTTGDLTYSQDLLNTSLDISAATGADLGAVTDAVAKAYSGNTKALASLIPSLRDTIKEGASLDQIMSQVAATVGGAASVAANSAEGQMKRLSITLSETKESIGAAFLPILERLLPVLQDMAKFVQENTDLIVKLIVIVGGLATGILALNAAMKVYNATMIVVEIATKALTASNVGLGASFATTGGKVAIFSGVIASLAVTIDQLSADGGFAFKELAHSISEFVNIGIAGFEALANSAVLAVNYINRAFNAISPIDIPLIPEARLPRVPDYPFGRVGSGATAPAPGPTSGPDFVERTFGPPVAPVVPVVPVVPPTAGGGGGGAGGGAAAPRTGLIDQLYDILPVDQIGGGGGGFGAAPGNEALLDGLTGGITIVVNAAIAEATLADKIVDTLTEYNRRSGPLQLEIA
jgi:hypothetical protein